MILKVSSQKKKATFGAFVLLSNNIFIEGAGFEDERLAIGQRDEKAQLLRHRKEMEDAINE